MDVLTFREALCQAMDEEMAKEEEVTNDKVLNYKVLTE